MEPIGGTGTRSTTYQFPGDSLHTTMAPPTTGNSFTALLEMPPSQAMELLHSGGGGVLNRHRISHQAPYNHALTNRERVVKSEPAESGSNEGSGPSSVDRNEKAMKRKEREKKGKGTSNKSKIDAAEDREKLPYVHVRARRGQATDSHSLAERARREKINARMKLLQELVPGCNKISGTALVLDEIINHVQGLQRQVEYLSMRLAAVNPRVDFNLESLLAAGNGALMDSNYQNMAMPPTWPEIQMNGDRQQSQQQWHAQPSNQPIWVREEDHLKLCTPEGSLLSYDSAHSASLHSSQLKMEL